MHIAGVSRVLGVYLHDKTAVAVEISSSPHLGLEYALPAVLVPQEF